MLLPSGEAARATPLQSKAPTGRKFPATTCERPAPALKPDIQRRSFSMIAILTILVFVVAIGALNVYEFGRLD